MEESIMTIQIISDIHGSASDLKAALEAGKRFSPEYLLLLGDFLNHGPRNPLPEGYDTKAAASLLNAHKDRIVCVRGNCDSEVDQMMLEFPCLAPYTNVIVGSSRIFAHHGHALSREQLGAFLQKGTLVVSGHTHVPLLEEEGGLIYFNPGSISLPKGESEKSFGLIECGSDGIKKISLRSIEGREILFRENNCK